MKWKTITVLLLLVIMVTPIGGCKPPATAPPTTSKAEITVGFLEALTGPMAATAIQYVDGEQDAIRYLNEKGGVAGHPLKTTVIDFKMDAAAAISGWDRLKSEGVPFIMGTTAALPMLLEFPNRDHIPFVGSGGTSIDLTFPKQPSYFFQTTPMLFNIMDSYADNIAAKDWAAKGEKRTPKLGFDFVSIGTMPQEFSKKIKMVMQAKGWDFFITRTSIAPADVTTQVLQMKNFGCDYLYLYNSESAMIVWIKELERQHFKPILSGTSQISSEEVWRAVGPSVVGTTMPQFYVQWTDTDIQGVKLLRELNAKYHPDVQLRTGYYCRGFTEFLVMAEALDRAIKKVGYENLTRDAMKDAMETIKDVDPMSMGMGYTWTPTDHQGLHGCRWYKWTAEGTLSPVGGWDVFPPVLPEQQTDAFWLQP